jgi:beta-glucanase (GH16 family)
LRRAALAFAIALGACGLADPPAPPARIVGAAPDVGGAEKTDRPIDDGGGGGGGGGGGVTLSPPFPGYELAWHDEFDGAALEDLSWTIEEGPWRDAVNSRESVVVEGGILSMVTFTSDGVHYSPKINTKGKVEPRYGYFEARVRFLDSAGQWCSFFLYPASIGKPVGDPGTAGVEIDVFEHRDANREGFPMREMVQVGINWDGFGADWKKDHRMLAHPDGAPLSHAWNTYAVLWTESGQTFYIDDIPVWTTNKAVSHIPMPIYFACEVRNNSWAGFIPASGYGSLASSTTRMEVDWVRVWQAAR